MNAQISLEALLLFSIILLYSILGLSLFWSIKLNLDQESASITEYKNYLILKKALENCDEKRNITLRFNEDVSLENINSRLAFNGSNLIILYDINTNITNKPKAREHNVIVSCSGVG